MRYRYVIGILVMGTVATGLSACGSPGATSEPAPPPPARSPLDGAFQARSPGAIREVTFAGDKYTMLRFDPCVEKEGEPSACVEEGTIVAEASSVVFRERTTGRATTLPLEIVRMKTAAVKTLTLAPAAGLVGGGANLMPGGQIDVFRAGDQAFQRAQLVTDQSAPCASLGGSCMQRAACSQMGNTQDMFAVALLWANDCAFDSGEICCALNEKWSSCQTAHGGECELPGNCEFPRQFMPSNVKTNCGDDARPGTVCCIQPLTS